MGESVWRRKYCLPILGWWCGCALPSAKMVNTLVHRGGCHCGKVRFQVTAADELVAWDCNCSNCAMRKNTHFIVPASDFKLEAASEDWLTIYTFGSRQAKHTFCKVCGISPFYIPRSNPDGVAVTVHCVDAGTIKKVEVRAFDGQNWDAAYAESNISAFSKSATD